MPVIIYTVLAEVDIEQSVAVFPTLAAALTHVRDVARGCGMPDAEINASMSGDYFEAYDYDCYCAIAAHELDSYDLIRCVRPSTVHEEEDVTTIRSE